MLEALERIRVRKAAVRGTFQRPESQQAATAQPSASLLCSEHLGPSLNPPLNRLAPQSPMPIPRLAATTLAHNAAAGVAPSTSTVPDAAQLRKSFDPMASIMLPLPARADLPRQLDAQPSAPCPSSTMQASSSESPSTQSTTPPSATHPAPTAPSTKPALAMPPGSAPPLEPLKNVPASSQFSSLPLPQLVPCIQRLFVERAFLEQVRRQAGIIPGDQLIPRSVFLVHTTCPSLPSHTIRLSAAHAVCRSPSSCTSTSSTLQVSCLAVS